MSTSIFCRLTLIFAGFLWVSCSTTAPRNVATQQGLILPFKVENKIMPFSTDGCSLVPNGIGIESRKWMNCCIDHDIDYWQGGTEEQRQHADTVLKQCVAVATNPAWAKAMYLGVRVGGSSKSLQGWKWGYGWILNNGDDPLTSVQLEQVKKEKEKMIPNYVQMKKAETEFWPERKTLTGDFCLDEGLNYIRRKIGQSFMLLNYEVSKPKEQSDGWFVVNYDLRTDQCSEQNIRFTFHLAGPRHCQTEMTEFNARGQIRMAYPEPPSSCPFNGPL